MPQASIDPVVMAAATVMRLQTIVSREVAATEAAVVTVGALQAGTKENVIPDEAIIKLNVRTFDEDVRKRVLAAIERIVNAEAAASGAPRPPEITTLDHYPLNVNDGPASQRIAEAFRDALSCRSRPTHRPGPASEDFGCFGTEWHVPSVFWFVGGTDPDTYAKSQGSGPAQRIAGQSQSAFRAGHSPDVAYRRRSDGRRLACLAFAIRMGEGIEMISLNALLSVFDLGGTFVFAISGGSAGVNRRLDLFGVLVLSFVAGNVGGITRDLLIGAVPPAAIADWRYLTVSLLAGAITFFWYSGINRLSNPVLIFDAAGLAFFAVAGAQKAIAFGLNPLMSALLGMLTGIGGGMMRDVLLAEIPTVLRADLYAVAALVGASVVVIGAMLHLPSEARQWWARFCASGFVTWLSSTAGAFRSRTPDVNRPQKPKKPLPGSHPPDHLAAFLPQVRRFALSMDSSGKQSPWHFITSEAENNEVT